MPKQHVGDFIFLDDRNPPIPWRVRNGWLWFWSRAGAWVSQRELRPGELGQMFLNRMSDEHANLYCQGSAALLPATESAELAKEGKV